MLGKGTSRVWPGSWRFSAQLAASTTPLTLTDGKLYCTAVASHSPIPSLCRSKRFGVSSRTQRTLSFLNSLAMSFAKRVGKEQGLRRAGVACSTFVAVCYALLSCLYVYVDIFICVCFIASQLHATAVRSYSSQTYTQTHTDTYVQLKLQQYTTRTVYVSSKLTIFRSG